MSFQSGIEGRVTSAAWIFPTLLSREIRRNTMRSCFLLVAFLCHAALAEQPLGLPPVSVPRNNPQSPEEIALGAALFSDTRFSADGTVSCAGCHRPDQAFTDGLARARGVRRLEGTRNAPTLANAAFYTSFFLDGRRRTLEEQALDPFVNPIEHGLNDHGVILDVVRADPGYRQGFLRVFGLAPERVSMEHVVQAIASFERTLVFGDSPFDRYLYKGEKQAMSESAIRGLRLFRRKGNCANCHEIGWQAALFTDNLFYNLGVGFDRIKPILPRLTQELQTAMREHRAADLGMLTEAQRSELGRFNVTGVLTDIGRFKTPTLRNVAVTAPYMHDGSIQTLEEVIEFYDEGGTPNPMLDKGIFPLKLSVQEEADLLAFLQALTSPAYQSTLPGQ